MIIPLKKKFKLSTEAETEFVYTGLDIRQSSSFISLSQLGYVDQASDIKIDSLRVKENTLGINEQERTQLRSTCGQLLWLTTQSRPDVAYATCVASNSLTQGQISDLKLVNKTVKFIKKNPLVIRYPKIDFKGHKYCMVIFCDASFANLRDGNSQGGYLLLLVSKSGDCCPLSWQSKKLRRVCKSTLGAEAWAMVEAVESCELIVAQLCEIIRCSSIHMVCLTDCKSLFDSVHTTNNVLDKGLRIPIACLRQRVEKGELIVRWIDTKHQLADSLTKAGASSVLLRDVLSNGKLSSEFIELIF